MRKKPFKIIKSKLFKKQEKKLSNKEKRAIDLALTEEKEGKLLSKEQVFRKNGEIHI